MVYAELRETTQDYTLDYTGPSQDYISGVRTSELIDSHLLVDKQYYRRQKLTIGWEAVLLRTLQRVVITQAIGFCLSVCLSVSLYVCVSVCLSIRLFVCLNAYRLSICRFVYLSGCLCLNFS